jgi:lipopolysaccharide biosynthesis glycosyltransferase
VDVTFLRPDLAEVQRMPVSEHVSHSTYLRLILPDVVPRDEERAIYLDSDLLVQRDLAELWDIPLDGAVVLAAQDVGFPYLDAEKALPNYGACKPYLAGARPIANYVELGLAPEAPYFNGGVMVMDLATWRAEGLTEKMLRCLHDHREHAIHWDQYALNVVLSGRWRRLDLCWNAATALRNYPSADVSPFSAQESRLPPRSPG